MFSIIIATHDSERVVVPTLCALVPGATMGIVREVIVADAGSQDQTEAVADIAGCRFISSSEPLGTRLKAAAANARGTWLMFLTDRTVPGPGWIDETIGLVEETERRAPARAAVFAHGGRDLRTLVRAALRLPPRPHQGLMIAKAFYQELGGHAPAAEPETDLLRRIGRRRLVTLRTAVTATDI